MWVSYHARPEIYVLTYSVDLSHLPHLRSLSLRGMRGPSTGRIKDILALLPHLVDLDVEYYGSSGSSSDGEQHLPALRSLKVHTSAVDAGPQEIWSWILQLVPQTSLESLTVQAFSAQSRMEMPSAFIASMSSIHGETVRELNVDQVIMSAEVLGYACAHLPVLENLSCSLPWCRNIVRVLQSKRSAELITYYPGRNRPHDRESSQSSGPESRARVAQTRQYPRRRVDAARALRIAFYQSRQGEIHGTYP